MEKLLDETPPPLPSHITTTPGSGWPKTLGIITIIFGVLGSLGGLLAFVNPFILRSQLQNYVQLGADPVVVDAYIDKMVPYQITLAVLTLTAGLLLLAGGLTLVKKRVIAVKLLLAWGVYKIGVGIYTTVRSLPMVREQMEIMQSSTALAGEAGEAIGKFTSIATTFGMIAGLVWAAVLPVFLFIWFSRAKIREQIKAW
jgi:hypothetical protein